MVDVAQGLEESGPDSIDGGPIPTRIVRLDPGLLEQCEGRALLRKGWDSGGHPGGSRRQTPACRVLKTDHEPSGPAVEATFSGGYIYLANARLTRSSGQVYTEATQG
jgi:hypothetical protein